MKNIKRIKLDCGFHLNQEKIFLDSDARYKIIAKGRRFGLTKGMANYVIYSMFRGVTPVLWVDTTYANIEKYFERYFLPVLKEVPKAVYKFRQIKNDFKLFINGEKIYCDFRSADKPENIEGFGYKLIILNEAGIILKNRALWEESILPMALDYKADIIVGGTPKGKRNRNETHLFYELWDKGLKTKMQGSKWEAFNFSSYENPLLETKEVKELESNMPPNLRLQEIHGKFVDELNTGIIKKEWFGYYSPGELSQKRNFGIYQSWDTAFKKNEENDYSVCTTWQVTQNGFYLIDVFRKRLEFPELKKEAARLADSFKPRYVLIEDKASGQSLIQELERKTRIPIKRIKTDSDKIARLNSVSPLFESGKVLVPHPQKKSGRMSLSTN
jgi:predicted phage terminase large subunit-like protein